MQQMMDQQEQQASSSSSSSSSWVSGVVGIARVCYQLGSSKPQQRTQQQQRDSSSCRSSIRRVCLSCRSSADRAAAGAHSSSSSSSSCSQHSPSSPTVAVQLLVLEAAWATALVGVTPLLNLAAAAGIAVTLLSLHRQVVAPRLLQYQAASGDRFQAHISLKLQGSAAAFDTTISAEPVALVAAQRSNEHAQNWKQLGSDAFWEKLATQQDAAQAAADAAAAGEEGASTAAAPLRGIAQGLRGWMGTPAARWEPLLPFVEDAACGMFVGETRTLEVYNPKAGGYWNPSYSWWQPTADVLAKFKGQVPAPGDVFLYPVADGAFVPTRVAAIGEQYVELDANYGVAGAQLQLEVRLVGLQKQ
ncbi:hypothetical protein COO60DRAFT_1486295 [Scenedesmus sp. NREL 46B-D3]|nr:hypothetical protein COO60DRAFT_1486295 [Scenedesmus sp. NREL 46B-D3]